MSFVRSFVRVDRWLDWHQSIPIYDGRDCPDCGLVAVGKKRRKQHQEYHDKQTEYDSYMREAVRRALTAAGLNPVLPAPEDSPDGLYDVDEDQDERLTRKARQVAELDDYDEEDDDDDL